ncbi:hypothetical protein E1B28_002349 [Marasmius oreades]|uniref:Cytochrome P450 n=1 Tax=Marasmius oreades TaxID=181124 RepID=A0A9P7RMN9_9AGAR|nr:uncharacterized protein E1B28_002349 [Marasmius oreades]KAG7086394.1 hypothetical protein E1B28_002349 [Marasmius oreades]
MTKRFGARRKSINLSIPNQRLVRAFGLTNTFVSAGTAVRDQFRRDALALLNGRASRLGWAEYLEVALESVKASLSDERPFDQFIQITTLRIILIVLLGVPSLPEELNGDDLQITAGLISELWDQSKTSSPTDKVKLDLLNLHLRRLLVRDLDAFPNPLDIVIPAWETLWRVIATTVAYVHDNQSYREAFGGLRNSQDPGRTFSSPNAEDGSSVQSIITEILRLHPPSRRIHRAISCSPFFIPRALKGVFRSTRLEVADIEALHRSSEIWGPSSNEFQPARHDESKESEGIDSDRKILAFGSGRLQCPAKKWAPLAAAMAVAAILEFLESDSGYTLVRGETIGSRKGWEGWMIRKMHDIA